MHGVRVLILNRPHLHNSHNERESGQSTRHATWNDWASTDIRLTGPSLTVHGSRFKWHPISSHFISNNSLWVRKYSLQQPRTLLVALSECFPCSSEVFTATARYIFSTNFTRLACRLDKQSDDVTAWMKMNLLRIQIAWPKRLLPNRSLFSPHEIFETFSTESDFHSRWVTSTSLQVPVVLNFSENVLRAVGSLFSPLARVLRF